MIHVIFLGGFDRVVVATGVTPRNVKLPSSVEGKILSYVDVLTGRATVGPRVAIIGAGGIGFDVAEYLSVDDARNKIHSNEIRPAPVEANPIKDFLEEWNIDPSNEVRGGLLGDPLKTVHSARTIYLCQRKSGKVGATLGKTTGWIHRSVLKKKQVEFIEGCEYVNVDERGLHIKVKPKGSKKSKNEEVPAVARSLEVDNVILCAGQEKENSLVAQLQKANVHVNVIGGAEQAAELDAKRAIDQGVRLAAVIENSKPLEVYAAPITMQNKITDWVLQKMGK